MAELEKKSERMEIRLGYQEKSDFVEACDLQGDTPSSALRRFIRGYIRRSDVDLFSSAWRGLRRERRVVAILAGVTVFAILTGFWRLSETGSQVEKTDMVALNAQLAQRIEGPSTVVKPEDLPERAAVTPSLNAVPDIDQIRFDDLDRDGDGVLRKGEILASDHHLHRVLDVDGKAGISPAEFYTKGTMQYRVAKKWIMKKSKKSYQLEHVGDLDIINLTFDLTQSRPLINPARPLEETIIERHDRTVIWVIGETTPHSTWTNDTHPIREKTDDK